MIGDKEVLGPTKVTCSNLKRPCKRLQLERLESRRLLAANMIELQQVVGTQPKPNADFSMEVDSEFTQPGPLPFSHAGIESEFLPNGTVVDELTLNAIASDVGVVPNQPLIASSSGTHAEFFAALPQWTNLMGPELKLDDEPVVEIDQEEPVVSSDLMYGPSPVPSTNPNDVASALDTRSSSDLLAEELNPELSIESQDQVIAEMEISPVVELETFSVEAETVGIKTETESSTMLSSPALTEELEDPVLVHALEPTLALAHESRSEPELDSTETDLDLVAKSRQHKLPVLISPASVVSELALEFDVLETAREPTPGTYELHSAGKRLDEFSYFEEEDDKLDSSRLGPHTDHQLSTSMEHQSFIAMMVIRPKPATPLSVSGVQSDASVEIQTTAGHRERRLLRLKQNDAVQTGDGLQRDTPSMTTSTVGSRDLLRTEGVGRGVARGERANKPQKRKGNERQVHVESKPPAQPVNDRPTQQAASVAAVVAALSSPANKRNRRQIREGIVRR